MTVTIEKKANRIFEFTTKDFFGKEKHISIGGFSKLGAKRKAKRIIKDAYGDFEKLKFVEIS